MGRELELPKTYLTGYRDIFELKIGARWSLTPMAITKFRGLFAKPKSLAIASAQRYDTKV